MPLKKLFDKGKEITSTVVGSVRTSTGHAEPVSYSDEVHGSEVPGRAQTTLEDRPEGEAPEGEARDEGDLENTDLDVENDVSPSAPPIATMPADVPTPVEETPQPQPPATSLLQKANQKRQELTERVAPGLSSVKEEVKQKVDSVKQLAAEQVDALEGVLDRKTALLEEGKATASALISHAGDTKDKIVREIKELLRRVEDLLQHMAKDTKEWAKEKREHLKKWLAELKERMHLWVLERVEDLIDRGLDKCLPKLRRTLKDPYMPLVLQRGIDRMIDSVWYDVKEEVIELVSGLLRPALPEVTSVPHDSCLMRFKAVVRYAMFPYDQSIWQQLRNPLFVFIRVVCLIPFPGILQVVWFFILFCIDRDDEFQLLQYITQFKSMQFLTTGMRSSLPLPFPLPRPSRFPRNPATVHLIFISLRVLIRVLAWF